MTVFRPLSGDAPALLAALADEDERHPLARKLVVAPAAGAGRELLRTLARLRGGWTGFEVTTLRPLAAQLAVEWIASEGVRVASRNGSRKSGSHSPSRTAGIGETTIPSWRTSTACAGIDPGASPPTSA